VVKSCLSLPRLFSSEIQFVRRLWFSVVTWMCLERNHFGIPARFLSTSLMSRPSYAVVSSLLIFGPLFLCLYYEFLCLSLLHFFECKNPVFWKLLFWLSLDASSVFSSYTICSLLSLFCTVYFSICVLSF